MERLLLEAQKLVPDKDTLHATQRFSAAETFQYCLLLLQNTLLFLYLKSDLRGECMSMINYRHSIITIPAVQFHTPTAL